MANDGTAIRFLSTLDSKNYKKAGFIFSGNYNGSEIPETDRSITKLYKTITAANQSVQPTVFSDQSQFFFAFAVRKMNSTASFSFTVRAYFETQDGTIVKGIPNSHSRAASN